MNVGDLAQLLGQAVQPEPGRRYPNYANAPQGLDILGEVLKPSDLPNPDGVQHGDPMEWDYIRPQIDTQNGPQWQWRF